MGPSDGHYGSVKMQEEPETGVSRDGNEMVSWPDICQAAWQYLLGNWISELIKQVVAGGGEPLIASGSRAEACAFLENSQELLMLSSGTIQSIRLQHPAEERTGLRGSRTAGHWMQPPLQPDSGESIRGGKLGWECQVT